MANSIRNKKEIRAYFTQLLKTIEDSDINCLQVNFENDIEETPNDYIKSYRPTGYHTVTIRYYIKPNEGVAV